MSPLGILKTPSLTSLCALTSHGMSTFSRKTISTQHVMMLDMLVTSSLSISSILFNIPVLCNAFPFQLLSAWYQGVSRSLFKPEDFLIIMSLDWGYTVGALRGFPMEMLVMGLFRSRRCPLESLLGVPGEWKPIEGIQATPEVGQITWPSGIGEKEVSHFSDSC